MNETGMGSYKLYPEYKDSGIAWLGEVPRHWEIKPLKISYRFEKGKNSQNLTASFIQDNPGDYPVYSGQTENDGIMGLISSYEYELDEVLFSTTVGAKVMTPLTISGRFSLSQNCLIMIPINSNAIPRYYFYQLHPCFSYQRSSIPDYMQPSLRILDLKRYKMASPEVKEQKSIAAFLDRKTAEIDALIAKKERLIELLQEKRAALITQAVTKGLDPDVEMKDSGVEWLGEIPAHWELVPLKQLFEFLDHKRIPLSATERGKMERIFPYYGASGIIDYVDDYLFDEPLILIGEDGANLILRSTPIAFIVRGKCWVNNHAHVLRPRKGPIEYWEAALQVYEYDPFITGAAQPKLNKENLKSIILPLPPQTEREMIGKYIHSSLERLDQASNSITHGIEMIKEYRSALITAAVTGKIDVRGEVEVEANSKMSASQGVT